MEKLEVVLFLFLLGSYASLVQSLTCAQICLNGATCNSVYGECECTNGHYGPQCEKTLYCPATTVVYSEYCLVTPAATYGLQAGLDFCTDKYSGAMAPIAVVNQIRDDYKLYKLAAYLASISETGPFYVGLIDCTGPLIKGILEDHDFCDGVKGKTTRANSTMETLTTITARRPLCEIPPYNDFNTTCPNGSMTTPSIPGFCYTIYNAAETYARARFLCSTKNGDLGADLVSSAFTTLLTDLRNSGTLNKTWVGAINDWTNQQIRTLKGIDVTATNAIQWAAGQPNTDSDQRNCGQFNGVGYTMAECTAPSPFLCVYKGASDSCSSVPCLNGGTCVVSSSGFNCTCASGYTGATCNVQANECGSLPCLNGGTCTDGVNSYTCTCVAGYNGVTCATNINECSSSPCQHAGTCIDGVNSYTCTCVAGYNGAVCATNINECLSSPCQNGGTCADAVNGYTCACVAGYNGLTCATNINECSSSPCQHAGTCVDGVNSYTCACVAGYNGVLCATNINECLSSPCQNGGTCADGVNGYACTCVAGYNGLTCATNINECLSSPCQHAGTCVDAVNSYTCTCVAGYVGQYCETEVDECASSPCLNGGSCVDAIAAFTCSCPSAYTGTVCQTAQATTTTTVPTTGGTSANTGSLTSSPMITTTSAVGSTPQAPTTTVSPTQLTTTISSTLPPTTTAAATTYGTTLQGPLLTVPITSGKMTSYMNDHVAQQAFDSQLTTCAVTGLHNLVHMQFRLQQRQRVTKILLAGLHSFDRLVSLIVSSSVANGQQQLCSVDLPVNPHQPTDVTASCPGTDADQIAVEAKFARYSNMHVCEITVFI